MINNFKYQQVTENKSNYLDPVVWEERAYADDGPDRRVHYLWKKTKRIDLFFGMKVLWIYP